MTRHQRTGFLLLLGSIGLVFGAAAVLLFTDPTFKPAVKERWHRWSCPDVPKARSERSTSSDGTIAYSEPFPFCALSRVGQPTLFYDFECPLSTFFTRTHSAFSGEGVLSGPWLSTAVVRRVGDVSERITSVSAGFMFNCSTPASDVQIVIRFDRADGTLIDWNRKCLRPDEYHPGEWERFNFEWLLRDLSLGPDDLVSVFILADDDGVMIDDLSIVFRSSAPLRPNTPHA